MNLKGPACRTGLVSGIVMALLGSNVVAQESLDRGKTPVQLFASHCSVCHKSPRGLAKSGGLFGLDGFLREHYMSSRENGCCHVRLSERVGRRARTRTRIKACGQR